MFTGITRGTFPITKVERTEELLRYAVELPFELAEGLQLGASVSIDGVCQTVTRVDQVENSTLAHFDAISETLDKTTLGLLKVGHLVSVERSFRVGDEIGGHEVAGHVSGTGAVAVIDQSQDRWDIQIEVPDSWLRYIQPKGFIAIDGSSLTVGEVSRDGRFWIHLIPETLRLTALGNKRVGDRVNVELDARTVDHRRHRGAGPRRTVFSNRNMRVACALFVLGLCAGTTSAALSIEASSFSRGATRQAAAPQPSSHPSKQYERLLERNYLGPIELKETLELTHQEARWTLREGRVWLQEPLASGAVTGLVFQGSGSFEAPIPDATELHQFRRFVRDPEFETLSHSFDRLVLRAAAPGIATALGDLLANSPNTRSQTEHSGHAAAQSLVARREPRRRHAGSCPLSQLSPTGTSARACAFRISTG